MHAYSEGDTVAFTDLFLRYSRKLLSFLRARLGSKKAHLVDEIYQKTWLKIHTARKTFNPKLKFSTWFYTVALNTLRDEVNTRQEKNFYTELDDQIPSGDDGAEAQLILKDKMHEYEAAISTLSHPQQTALILSDQEELSSKEIAEIMKISDALARKLISRARQKVRTQLKEVEA